MTFIILICLNLLRLKIIEIWVNSSKNGHTRNDHILKLWIIELKINVTFKSNTAPSVESFRVNFLLPGKEFMILYRSLHIWIMNKRQRIKINILSSSNCLSSTEMIVSYIYRVLVRKLKIKSTNLMGIEYLVYCT